jgi:hypothetical protein
MAEWNNPDNKGGLVWYIDGSENNTGTSAGVYRWGSTRRHSFSLGLHAMVFQAAIYAIKAFITENTEKSYTGKKIYILSDSQAAIKALDSFQINSKLVWDCHQSLVQLAGHNRIRMVWVLGYMGIDGNETGRQGSSHPLIRPAPALGIAAKVARRGTRDCTSRKHEEQWQSIREEQQAKGFLKPSAKKKKKKAGKLHNLCRNQLRILPGFLMGHSHLKRRLFKLGLVNSP